MPDVEIIQHGNRRTAMNAAQVRSERWGPMASVLHQDKASVVLKGEDVVEVHTWVNGHE
jgi:hypothetical protein